MPTGYRYFTPPVLSAASPATGPSDGGTLVTLHGYGFRSATQLECRFAGEVVVAFVMADASVTPDLLNGQCREQLTAYKVPEHICVERELPLTPNGKLDRLQLRDLAARTFGR